MHEQIRLRCSFPGVEIDMYMLRVFFVCMQLFKLIATIPTLVRFIPDLPALHLSALTISIARFPMLDVTKAINGTKREVETPVVIAHWRKAEAKTDNRSIISG